MLENVTVPISTNESNINFVKQASGPKFAKVGAVLFSDKNGIIKSNYELGNLKNYTFKQFENNCTIIYNNIEYNYDNGVYVRTDTKTPTIDDLFNVETSKSNNKCLYKLNLASILNNLNIINGEVDMVCDGYAILGIPHKPHKVDYHSDNLVEQTYSIISIVYFPNEKLPIYVIKNTAGVTPILSVEIDCKEMEVHKDTYFLTGFHLVDDGKNIRGI